MAFEDIKISELPDLKKVDNDDVLVVNYSKTKLTYQVSWDSLKNSLGILANPVTFPLGTVDVPGVCIGDVSSGIYAEDFGTLTLVTQARNRLTIDQAGTISLVNGSVVIGRFDRACVHTFVVNSRSTFNCYSTFNNGIAIKGDTTFGGNLLVSSDANFEGNVSLGSNCDNTIILKGESSVECGLKVAGDAEVKGFLDVRGDFIVDGSVDIGLPNYQCAGDLSVHTPAVFDCDLTVKGENITLGSGCSRSKITLNGVIDMPCGVTLAGDFDIDGLLTVNSLDLGDPDLGCGDPGQGEFNVYTPTHSRCDFTVDGETVLNSDVTIGSNSSDDHLVIATQYNRGDINIGDGMLLLDPAGNLNQWKAKLDSTSGDITTRGYFVGDGSKLFNLAKPNVMLFNGKIDSTTENPPSNAQPGDFWLNDTPGNVKSSWPDIGNRRVEQDQFIYYSQTAYDPETDSKTFEWVLGAVQDNSQYVTIHTEQTVTGSKTFTGDKHTIESEQVTIGTSCASDTLAINSLSYHHCDVTIGGRDPNDGLSAISATPKIRLNSDGTSEFHDLMIIGSQCNKDALLVKGDTKLNCDLTVLGDLRLPAGGGIDIGGPANIDGNMSIGTNCNTLLDINSKTNIKCDLTISDGKWAILGGTALIKDKVTIGDVKVCGKDMLLVRGKSNLECDTTIGGNVSITSNKNLTVDGSTTINKDINVKGNAIIGTGSTCGNTLNINSTTEIQCPTTIKNTFTVSGNYDSVLGGNLTVADGKDTVLGGTLLVKDGKSTTLGGTLTVRSNTSIGGTLIVADNMASTLGGNLQVKGNTAVNGTLYVSNDKSTTLGGDALIKKKLTLGDSKQCSVELLYVRGKSRFECPASFEQGIVTRTMELSNVDASLGNEVDGTRGEWSIQQGEEDLYVINRLTGKKYKMNLTPIE